MIPRDRLPDAVATIREMGPRINPHLLVGEIRTIAADAFWLSLAHGRDAVGLQFTWHKHVAEVDVITRELEARLLPLDARPHWGKLIHASAETLAPLYPRFADFRSRARAWDSEGKLRNPYLERHVFR